MYTVYCDNWILHNMTMPELKLVNPKLDLEVNKTGSFTFTIYPSHPYYNRLKRLKSIIRVYQNDRLIFRGRILNTEKGFRNQKQVTCEGQLAFLLDSVIRPYSFQGDVPDLFEYIITEHNKQVDEDKRFKVGDITVTDPNGYINRSDTQYLTAYDSLMNKLVNSLGGYLNIRVESDGVYIDYLEDFETLNPQTIELRKNILDLTDTTKGEDIATAIIPLGARIAEEGVDQEDQKRLTIAEVNSGVDYIYDEDAVATYGWIFKTVTWDDVTIASNLLRKGREELADSIKLSSTIEVKAVDLSGTDKSISSFRIGSYNKVVSDAHDLNETMLVTKMSLNLTAPQNDTLTLGVTRKSLTEQEKENNDKWGNIVERVEIIIGDYQVNKPIIEEITNRLTLELKRNLEMLQNYNPSTGVYTPDYTQTPLTITPTAKYRGKVVQPTYIWKRIVDGIETDLEGWESISDAGVLTINHNMAQKSAVYICYATYQSGQTSLVANATIDLNRVDDGNKGDPGDPGTPGKDAAIQSPTEPEDKTQLWLDTSVEPPLLKQWNGEEWVIVNDVQDQIQSLRQELLSSIEQTSTGIRSEVAENYYLKDETDTLVQSVSTSLEQTKDEFNFTFNQFEQDLDDLQSGNDAKFQEISRYIRFVDGNIVLGETGNELTLKIQHDRISFLQSDVEVAYFTDRKLYVTDGEYTNSLQLGNFAFLPRANGNLSFVKVK